MARGSTMASFEKVEGKKGTRWRASIQRQGYRKSKTFGTRREAERWARGIESELDSGSIFDDKLGQGVTLDELWDEYSAVRGVEWAATTAHTIQVVKRALGDMGKRPVQSLSRADIQAWVQELNRKYAASTTNLYFVHLSSALSYAVKAGYIRRNPAEAGIVRPRYGKRRGGEYVQLTSDQLDVLCETIRAGKSPVSEDRARLIRVLATAGMRWSEAVALTVTDVNFVQGEDGKVSATISITKGISGVNSSPVKTDLKTAGSRRRIPIAGEGARALLDQFNEATEAGRELLWVTVSGRPMTSPTGGSWWHTAIHSEACVEAGIPADFHIHSLRHHAATRLLQQGVPVTAVSRHLGHGKTSTTLDVYSHYVTTDDAAIRAAME